MAKSLVIVESPAKAATINKYLGSQYKVCSSVGHIRDLPQKGSKGSWSYPEDSKYERLANSMGIDPEHDWGVHYAILPGKEKVVRELRSEASKCRDIYLATDLDREGEAIAWHLREVIGSKNKQYHRVIFSEITKSAIQQAFDSPTQLDLDKVNAQQTRRFLDRVVGYMLSPLLWTKVARGLSAGRVQSVAVRLVVERENEIQCFRPEEYWELRVDVVPEGSDETLSMQVMKHGGKEFRPNNGEQMQQALEQLQARELLLTAREDKKVQSRPPAPFITSTLQQAASVRLGFGVRRTMSAAQRLYEAGRISYMRTDSTNLSREAISSIREFIANKYGNKYLPGKANVFGKRNASAQEAHEAIRPTDVALEPSKLPTRDNDERKLYQLIWKQTVATQMTNAEYLNSTLKAECGAYELRAKGRVLLFDGFTKLLPPADSADKLLPDIQPQLQLLAQQWHPSQHFTKPPPRYSEASLVRELEKRGIGRPSTYAAIISTIQDRGYVSLEAKRFHAQKIGEVVTNRLKESFTDLMDYSFTSKMEENLDKIANGESNWHKVLNDFYHDFKKKLSVAEGENGMQRIQAAATEIECPLCSRPLLIRSSANGLFLGCSGYGDKSNPCSHTANLAAIEPPTDIDEDEYLRSMPRCSNCSAAMHPFLISDKLKLHICARNPECNGNEKESGDFALARPHIECDKCGASMVMKSGRFGKYFDCTAEDCRNTRKVLANGQAAPPKMTPIAMPDLICEKVDDHYLLRDGASGLFLAASKFPKNRETRPVTVHELMGVRDQLDPKYHYLLSAPALDDKGFPAEVRFSRKEQQSYVASSKNGKLTGWSARYKGGSWIVTAKKSARSRAAKK